MGEIAEMMLSGEMCQGCGEFLDEELGYPGYCAGCSVEFAPEETSDVEANYGPVVARQAERACKSGAVGTRARRALKKKGLEHLIPLDKR